MSVDTLTLAQRLRAAELPAGHAEAIAAAIGAAVLEGAATRDDLTAAKLELKADFSEARSELKAELTEVRSELKAELTEVRSELKAEIADVRSELKIEIAEVRSGLEAKIEQVRTEIERARNQLLLGFISSQIALGGIIIAVIKL